MLTSISNQFADEFTGHSVNLLRFSESVRTKVVGMLKQLEEDLVSQIRDIDIGSTKGPSWRLSRLNELLKQTRKTISTAYLSSTEQLQSQLLRLSEIETKASVKLINDVIGADLAGIGIQKSVLKELATQSIVNGAIQSDWWSKQATDTVMRFQTQMRIGTLAGETNADLIARLRGEATGRKIVYEVEGKKKIFNETSGGIMQVSRRDAEALVRTSVQTVANNVRFETLKENDDIVKGVQLLVTLDNRTSEICMARSGGAWNLKTGKPLPESKVKIDFPGKPPYHWNCRSTLVPILKSWDQLAKGAVSGIEEIKPDTQSSMDGQVAADLSYEDWLKTKDEDFQKEVLGEGKWKLWTEGKITFPDLVSQVGNPLSLEELEAKFG
jgi:SPP1 gp7 family putative phage head morphogenesis protein